MTGYIAWPVDDGGAWTVLRSASGVFAPVASELCQVSSALGPSTVTLPAPVDERAVVGVADLDGFAATNPITVLGGGNLIDGAASAVLDVDGIHAAFVFDGVEWVRILPDVQVYDGPGDVATVRGVRARDVAGTGGGGSAASDDGVIYRPGGVSSGNVLATAAEVAAACLAAHGALTVYVDPSLSPTPGVAVMPAGVVWEGAGRLKIEPYAFTSASTPVLGVEDGAQIRDVLSFGGNLVIASRCTSAPPLAWPTVQGPIVRVGGNVQWYLDAVATEPFVRVPPGGGMVIVFDGASGFDNSAAPAVPVVDVGAGANMIVPLANRNPFATTPSQFLMGAGATITFARDATAAPSSLVGPGVTDVLVAFATNIVAAGAAGALQKRNSVDGAIMASSLAEDGGVLTIGVASQSYETDPDVRTLTPAPVQAVTAAAGVVDLPLFAADDGVTYTLDVRVGVNDGSSVAAWRVTAIVTAAAGVATVEVTAATGEGPDAGAFAAPAVVATGGAALALRVTSPDAVARRWGAEASIQRLAAP